MPRRVDPKCAACAQLSAAEARQLHGPAGDGCWNEQRCPRRRSHYRHRRDNNAKRRGQYRQQVLERQRAAVDTLAVPLPLLPVAYLYLYRGRRQDAPLHAIAISVWQGDEKLLEIKPIHCAGLRNQQVQAYLKDVLAQLKERYGIGKFEPPIRLEPMSCPIADCALKETTHE